MFAPLKVWNPVENLRNGLLACDELVTLASYYCGCGAEGSAADGGAVEVQAPSSQVHRQVDATLAELAALGDRVRAAKGTSGNATALGAVVAEMTSLKSAAASAVELCLRHNLRQILAAQPPTAAPATPPESLSTHPQLQPLLYALPTQRKRQVEKELRAAHKQLLQSQQPPQKKKENKGAAPETARAICKACDRPARTCICPYLPKPRVPNELHVIVLMHPKELERKITTVKLAALSLAKCDVLVGRELDPFLRPGACPALAEALGEGHEGTGRTCVLFPGEGAFDMSAVAPPSAAGDAREATPRPPPLPRARFLLVFDGTWRFAREMFVKNRHHLQGVTQVQFSRPFGMGAAGLSEFVTRVEPAEMCASTLEAIVAALCTLEPSLESFRGRHATCERRCPIALAMHVLTHANAARSCSPTRVLARSGPAAPASADDALPAWERRACWCAFGGQRHGSVWRHHASSGCTRVRQCSWSTTCQSKRPTQAEAMGCAAPESMNDRMSSCVTTRKIL